MSEVLRLPGPAILAVLCVLSACMQKSAPATEPVAAAVVEAPAAAVAGCMITGEGRFEASLRGALEADLDWRNAQMECDGGMRPDGKGLRVAVAGPMQPVRSTSADVARRVEMDMLHRLRFIFGIDLHDTASGPAQALPTHLTVLVEGDAQLYATRGTDKCAVENLERKPLGNGVERVSARGYCISPASDLAGTTRLHVPTFSFTALVRGEDEEAPAQ
jgi:hypothetical protein